MMPGQLGAWQETTVSVPAVCIGLNVCQSDDRYANRCQLDQGATIYTLPWLCSIYPGLYFARKRWPPVARVCIDIVDASDALCLRFNHRRAQILVMTITWE